MPQIDEYAISIDGVEADVYVLQVIAKNGTTIETLQFKRGNNCLPWAYRFWIERLVVTSKQRLASPKQIKY
jgi:hypothetical protein